MYVCCCGPGVERGWGRICLWVLTPPRLLGSGCESGAGAEQGAKQIDVAMPGQPGTALACAWPATLCLALVAQLGGARAAAAGQAMAAGGAPSFLPKPLKHDTLRLCVRVFVPPHPLHPCAPACRGVAAHPQATPCASRTYVRRASPTRREHALDLPPTVVPVCL